MLLIVETQASDCADILTGQGCEEHSHVCDLVGNPVLAEDVTLDDSGIGGFGDIAHSRWEYSIAVIDLAILGQEADEVLFGKSVYVDAMSTFNHVIDLMFIFLRFVSRKMIEINFCTHSKGRHREIRMQYGEVGSSREMEMGVIAEHSAGKDALFPQSGKHVQLHPMIRKLFPSSY